jgi:hypothetical protein
MCAFLFLIGSALVSEVPLKEDGPAVFQQEVVESKKVCPYGSVSISSGPGISWRKQAGAEGTAIDLGAGMGPDLTNFLGINRSFKRISVDYNWMKFASETNSLYFSYGFGGELFIEDDSAYSLIYFPLRAGYQAKYGFADVGVNMFGPIPVPEARAGFSFDY